ncbi:unnamed protein product [Triticum turgidum subsp. durum]|uniref:Uncharacterized protein n=1 Tax=Triticum turgidum subsp. durum TaxID=4567 RepID=A0A9R1BJ07_TRITD|nr:unnamed protein product [Triticum turgidum subsp. durum]
MEAAAGALSPVLRKLGELLAGEYNLAKRVKKGVQSLRTELEMMHAVLREVGKVPPDQLQEPVRIWAGKVRDLSCDMEDAVDDFLVRVDEGPCSKPTNMRNRVKKFLKKTTKLFGNGKALHQISSAIKEAQDLATELVGLRKKYELDTRSTSNGATIDPRVLALHKDVGELVGVDRTRDEVIKTLICEDGSSKEQLKTISIVGVGGLGKTTLTKAVYEKIKTQFDCVAFVPVGQNPDIKKVFKDLLYGLDNEKFSDIHNTTRDENLLIKQISDFLVDKSRLFEIGKSYFNELMNRSLIQPAEINEEGTVVTCRIHDMVLDLICSLSSEENFISILDNDEWHAPNLQRKFRRLSLHNIKAKVQNHQFDSTSLSKVRTFAVFSPVTCDWLPSLSSFQFLRVLDLGNCGSHKSSSGISLKYVGNLIHLRYLGLRNADVDELPTDIGKLQLLQTLDITNTSIEELPASVVQLRNLICLCVNKDLMLPKEMGKLKSLEVLNEVGLSSSPHIVKELSHLTEVRTLSVECVNMDEDLIDILIKSLGNLHKLQNLRIHSGDRLLDRMCESWVPPPNLRSFDSWYFSSWFLRLPKWVNSSSLPHLSTLEIGVKELQGDDLQIIGMLPALGFLRLAAKRVMGMLVVRTDAFPSARCCMFFGFPTAPCLFPPGAMPRVQHLVFEASAPSIASREVDCGMGHLPSLEHVEVWLEHENSSDEEMETAKAWLRRAAEAHPKCPTIQMIADVPLPGTSNSISCRGCCSNISTRNKQFTVPPQLPINDRGFRMIVHDELFISPAFVFRNAAPPFLYYSVKTRTIKG